VTHFVDAFFDHLKELQESPRHPKWHHIDLAAPVPGWTRFAPAEKRVRSAALLPAPDRPREQAPDRPREQAPDRLFRDFAEYLQRQPQIGSVVKPASTLDTVQREALFRDFEAWHKTSAPPLDGRQRELVF
jgi:hypothetical protein